MPAPSISGPRLEALQNSHKKQLGHDVGFTNIAEAQALTNLGLALRTAQGWQITDAGAKLLATLT